MRKLFFIICMIFPAYSHAQQEVTTQTQSSPGKIETGKMHEDVDGVLEADEYRVISVNGGVTRRPCPYTCEDRGLSRSQCKEWRSNDKTECYVQDTSKPAEVMPK